MKKYFSIISVIAAMAFIASCSKDEPKKEKEASKPEERTTLEIVTKSLTLAREANSTGTATVNTNADGLIFDFGAADSWLNASFDSKNTITFTSLSANESTEVRTAIVTVKAAEGVTGTISVTQAASEKPVETTVVGNAYQKGDVKGVIFWVDPANSKKVKIVSLKANGPMNFCTNAEAAGSTVNALEIAGTSDTDGAANMTAISNFMSTNSIAESEMLGYAACKAEGDGWYLPSKGELADLVLGYSYGLDFATIEANLSTAGNRPSEWVGKLTDAGADPALIAVYKGAFEARQKMDNALVGLGGAPINSLAEDNSKIADGTTYLSSSQDSDAKKVGYACSGGRPRTSAAAKYAQSPSRYIRCIKVVTLD